MNEPINQRLRDSEENYLNTTFWDIHPLFLQVQRGETDALKKNLHIQLDHFPAGRITRDARKQLEYLSVSLVNTFMIAAIQGGVYPPEANAVADQALHALSQIKNVSQIPSIIREAAITLCDMASHARQIATDNIHVEKARHYLSTHLTQEIRIEDVASAVGLSSSHLSRLFKAKTSMTMQEYLMKERIETAKELLVTSDRSIPEIASLLRFCDQSYFTLVFRRETGTTPRQYRNAQVMHK